MGVNIGWVFGDAEITTTSNVTGKVEGKWGTGIAAGLEYKNINTEIGYQITEFEKSIKSSLYKGTSQEKLVYVSLRYRFE